MGWGALLIDQSSIVSFVFNLAVFFPAIAVATRRLHDTNRSGWWQLLVLTIIGIIVLIVWLASKGNEQPNRFGNPP